MAEAAEYADTAEAAESADAPEAAESADAPETAEAAEVELDCYSEKSVVLASNLESRCLPLAIERCLSWLLPVQSDSLHLQGSQVPGAQIPS
jgi:hypothetical protein